TLFPRVGNTQPAPSPSSPPPSLAPCHPTPPSCARPRWSRLPPRPRHPAQRAAHPQAPAEPAAPPGRRRRPPDASRARARLARDGSESQQDAFNARLRLAAERSLDERWRVRARVAGRFSSDQDGTDVYLRGYAPTRTGAAFGDVTVDEAYLGYQAPEDGLRFK